MENVIRARIVRIGNSRGIRIPRVWLEQLRFNDEVELAVEQDRLVVRRALRPRAGWREAFCAMAERRDDRLLDPPTSTRWEDEEWDWR